MQRDIELINRTIREYLERKSLKTDDPPWEIKKSEPGGFGLFATRAIEAGELIFKDDPVMLGPRVSDVTCVSCYKKINLKPCKKCGLRVCSIGCQDSYSHQKECKIIRQWRSEPVPEELSEKLVRVLTPIRFLLLGEEDKKVVKCLKAHRSDQHGFEIDLMKNTLNFDLKEDEEILMRFFCSIMDANAFEVVVGNGDNRSSVRGLYSIASLVNHSCTPNTIHVFDDGQRIFVRASTLIPKGVEISHCYSRFTWGTPTRRYYLYRTMHFLCKCQRCQDPTEFGTYVGATLCKSCKTGKVIPADPSNGKWQCESCGEIVNQREIAALSSVLGSTLSTFGTDDVELMLQFINKKLSTLVPENHETVVELKYQLIWILGRQQELSDQLLSIREKYCKDLLALLEMLRLGRCKMRGLLLFELYLCFDESKRRRGKFGNVSKNYENDMKNWLLEAADILMYDSGAPAEIKKLWPDQMK